MIRDDISYHLYIFFRLKNQNHNMLIESAVIEIMKRNELTLTYREIRMGKSLKVVRLHV